MKKLTNKLLFVAMVVALCLSAFAFTACNKEMKDYTGELKLDMTSLTHKTQATVYNYVDGDTTHFHINDSTYDGHILKVRYIGVDTPESTGQIEPWGKKAAAFTKEKLSSAESIMIECNGPAWETDSTGRYLAWVWYRTSADADYRLLNLEILQNGLAIPKSVADTLYGDICEKAIEQAKEFKMYVYSDAEDPDFYKGDAVPLTMKELRLNMENYNGVRVAVEGNVVKTYNNGVYVEEYDAEDDLYYGIYVYGGASVNPMVRIALTNGNRLRVVGKVSEYNGSYQITDVNYNPYDPTNINNISILGKDATASYSEVTAQRFNSKETVVVGDEGTGEYDFAFLALDSTITVKNLQVTGIFTTVNEESSSVGAMTITCKCGDSTITVRTQVLYDADGKLVTADAYTGKTITVKGIVDVYEGAYQIHVYDVDDITIQN